jgi:hypothetical protein
LLILQPHPDSQRKGRRRWWKNFTDRQKNAVTFFLVSVFRLSIYACLSTNKTRMQTHRSVKERKLTYLWSLWAYGTSDFCHYYDCDRIRSATQQQGQIDEGAERPAELPPTTRSPRTTALPKSKSTASTRDSVAILKCQLFFSSGLISDAY